MEVICWKGYQEDEVGDEEDYNSGGVIGQSKKVKISHQNFRLLNQLISVCKFNVQRLVHLKNDKNYLNTKH